MGPVNLLKAKNRDELRQWLEQNHKTEKECWVVVKRGKPKENNTFWYIDAVEEAMCFGWIDSTTKKLDNGITAQKLAPRRTGSLWSELNKERCRRMEKLGKMTEAGLKAVVPGTFRIKLPAESSNMSIKMNQKPASLPVIDGMLTVEMEAGDSLLLQF